MLKFKKDKLDTHVTSRICIEYMYSISLFLNNGHFTVSSSAKVIGMPMFFFNSASRITFE